MKKPVIDSNGPVYSQGIYDVFVGSEDGEKFPCYLVINRETSVLEFTSEVTLAYLNWLEGVTEAMEARTLRLAVPGPQDQQLDLNLVTKN